MMCKKMRLAEISLMTGFGIVAALFTKYNIKVERVSFLALASFTIVAAIYSANSYLGYKSDKFNPRLSLRQFHGRNTYLLLTTLFLSISLLFWHMLSYSLVPYALLFFALWLIYSFPGGAKYHPVLGTALHFTGVVLQFYMASIALGEDRARLLAISIYFGLLFAGGHIAHEIKDYSSDKDAGIMTNAVYFGISRMNYVYRLVVVITAVVWCILGYKKIVEDVSFWSFAVAIFLHLFFLFQRSREYSVGSNRLQQVYRVLYIVAGSVSAFSKL